jgi:hypothetical protein
MILVAFEKTGATRSFNMDVKIYFAREIKIACPFRDAPLGG